MMCPPRREAVRRQECSELLFSCRYQGSVPEMGQVPYGQESTVLCAIGAVLPAALSPSEGSVTLTPGGLLTAEPSHLFLPHRFPALSSSAGLTLGHLLHCTTQPFLCAAARNDHQRETVWETVRREMSVFPGIAKSLYIFLLVICDLYIYLFSSDTSNGTAWR